MHKHGDIHKPDISTRNKWLSCTQCCRRVDDSHTHAACVDTYSGYRVSALDGQKRSPAHLHTLWYQLFPLYHLPWSNPTISFWLNGRWTQTRSLSTWRQTQWEGEQVCVLCWRWEAKGSMRAKPPFIIVSSLLLSGQTLKSLEMNHWLL